MTRYKYFTDAKSMQGIIIFGNHWLSRKVTRELLEELVAITCEWDEEKIHNPPIHLTGNKDAGKG